MQSSPKLKRRAFLAKACVLGAAGLWIPQGFAQRRSISPLDTPFWASLSGQVPATNMQLWFKADGLALNNNDVVATLTDFSGRGRNFTQSTNSLRPIFKTAQLNSLPGVDFDGSDDFLSGNVDSNVTAFSLYVVFKMKSTASTPVPFRFGIDNTFGTSDGYAVIINGGNRSLQYRVLASPTTMADGAATTSFELWSVIADATPATALRVNRSGQTLTPSNAAFAASNNFGIVGKFGTFGLPASFVLCEMILYKVAHTGVQRDAIELYLHNKWGL